jgi:hypothetical protein
METLVETLLQNLKSELLAEYEKNNNNVQKLIVEKNEFIRTLECQIQSNLEKIKSLTTQVEDLTHECKNYENVSIHKNLAKQISEKDNEIRILNNRLSTFEKKYNGLNKKYEAVILQRDYDAVEEAEDTVTQEDVEEVVVEVEVEEEEDTVTQSDVEEVVEEVEVEEEEDTVTQSDASEVDASEVDASEVDAVDTDEEVIEVEFYEKRLKPKNGKGRVLFLITDDEQKDIYERLEDDEPGEHVGRLVGKSNKPHFF